MSMLTATGGVNPYWFYGLKSALLGDTVSVDSSILRSLFVVEQGGCRFEDTFDLTFNSFKIAVSFVSLLSSFFTSY